MANISMKVEKEIYRTGAVQNVSDTSEDSSKENDETTAWKRITPQKVAYQSQCSREENLFLKKSISGLNWKGQKSEKPNNQKRQKQIIGSTGISK